jgi:hypothetical protein
MNWFKRKVESTNKLTKIKRFDTKEEYLKILIELISDTEIDSTNWDKSSFITSLGGSLTFTKGRIINIGVVKKNEVSFRVEFTFSSSDEFRCDKIELTIAGQSKYKIEDCDKKIGDKAVRILYDFYCKEQIAENERDSKIFSRDLDAVNNVISKSTKRDDKLNSLGI